MIDGKAARSLGMSQRAINRAVQCGRWRRIFFDTFVIEGAPESFKQLAASASAAGAVCSHRCAAALFGLEGVPARHIEVMTTAAYKPTRFPSNVVVHRTCHLPDDHIVEHAGILVTSVGRTLLDLAGVCGHDVMRRAAYSAVQRHLVNPEQLLSQVRCCGRPGRAGTAAFRRFLAQTDWELDLSDSDLEDIAYSLIKAEGLPAPRRLYKVHDEGGLFLGELDLAYPARKVGIEVDSFAFHGDKPSFARDRARLNGLIARGGWTILHFVHEDARRPRRFIEDLRAVLCRA